MQAMERRVKMLILPVEVICAKLKRPHYERDGDCIQVHYLEGIPADAKIERVDWSNEYGAFLVFVSHASFPELEPGARPERVCLTGSVYEVRVKS